MLGGALAFLFPGVGGALARLGIARAGDRGGAVAGEEKFQGMVHLGRNVHDVAEVFTMCDIFGSLGHISTYGGSMGGM